MKKAAESKEKLLAEFFRHHLAHSAKVAAGKGERGCQFCPTLKVKLGSSRRGLMRAKMFAQRFSGYEFYSVMEGVRSRGDLTDFIQLILKGQQAYEFTVDLSAYGIRTGCSLATKGWWPGGNPPYGFDRLTFGPDGKPRYRYVSRFDKAVEKRGLDGALLETFQPIDDKGKLRSAYSDKLRSDKVKLVPNDGFARSS